ncbi:2-phospho-L-lactate guanylyltransferase [Amnibacterium flavum]|uniref:Phosphoenolpyruvate guanylyltransferase n=1 Tax=Amnibacterium flavum TaxID=2173173 RepID=A0A2V1HXI9_9MICO|nr:2-phospho-L-lactate guanylyltransferase [Amnibacterium flavum]PVZ96049.1 2-phospho-L-lactate guanylyltransferase [Amnibacterium flavum]
MTTEARWSIVVPVKGGDRAKSRLGADLRRGELAIAFALDTVRAVLAASAVREVVVVTDHPSARVFRAMGARVVSDPRSGLNRAIARGLDAVSGAGAGTGVILGDLPALRPEDLTRFLASANLVPAAIAGDAQGTGTAMSTARAGGRHRLRFGPDSRRLHREAGYVDLTRVAPPSLRSDVDTLDDLRTARRLGLGRSTAAVLVGAASEPGSEHPHLESADHLGRKTAIAHLRGLGSDRRPAHV